MKPLEIVFQAGAAVDASLVTAAGHTLEKTIAVVSRARSERYETPYASINAIADDTLRDHVKKLAEQKRALKPKVLIIVGIGGSNLGTMAIYQALNGIYANEITQGIRVYSADTVDPDSMAALIHIMRAALTAGEGVILNVVSKSGATTETVANFMVLLAIMQECRPHDFREHIVITTDEDSALWHYAHEYRIDRFAIPARIGGRYSVFSAVGLFPLALLGIDIDALHAGALHALEMGVIPDLAHNPAARSAALLYQAYQEQYRIHDMFLFGVQLEGIGKWYRQLLAESVGKEHNIHGQEVNVGMTPTVSIGSTDLHSVAQLYLGGPYDKFTTFVSVANHHNDWVVPSHNGVDQLVANIAGKSLSYIFNAILQGVYAAYQETERPFIAITLPECKAQFLGQFMQYAMLQTMYLGALLEVNVFDQPNVELYKAETRKMLARE